MSSITDKSNANILGIHVAHDSNVCLMVNGEIQFAIAEERLRRKKLFCGFPFKSLDWILSEAKLLPQQIDCIALCGEQELIGDYITTFRYLNFGERKLSFKIKLISYFISFVDNLFMTSFRNKLAFREIKKVLCRLGFNPSKIVIVDHHMAHIASAYYCSGWQDEHNVIAYSIDGKGDGLSHRTCILQDGKIHKISKTKDYDSIGLFYMMATAFLGFQPLRHEGKVTGLAAYGNKDVAKKLPSPIKTDGSGFENMLLTSLDKKNQHWIFLKLLFRGQLQFLKYLLFSSTAVKAHYTKGLIMDYFKRNFKNSSREDVACYAQEHLEQGVVKLIQHQVRQLKRSKVCLAGGVSANVKLNQKILEIPEVQNIYIQPSMGDGGLGMGSALYAYYNIQQHSHKPRVNFLKNVYLGVQVQNDEIKDILQKHSLNYYYIENIEERIAQAVADNKIVGCFNGRMEWGPRALGNRSILADPRDSTINDRLNKRLKRSEFMPFAPSILEDYAKEYFKGYQSDHIAAHFMTLTYDVYLEKRDLIPAVVHVDGTARPQVVLKEVNPYYYKIIDEFRKLTGLPLVINTSFNVHEEPIVCSPEDAIESFHQNAIDILALGNYIVTHE